MGDEEMKYLDTLGDWLEQLKTPKGLWKNNTFEHIDNPRTIPLTEAGGQLGCSFKYTKINAQP